MNTGRFYEIAYILDPQLEEEDQTSIIQRFSDLVTSRGGSVDHIDRWERRRLAFEVKGRREGYYVFQNITSDPDTEAEINRLLGLAEGVIRHMIVRRKQATVPPPIEELPEVEVTEPAAVVPASAEIESAEAAAPAEAAATEEPAAAEEAAPEEPVAAAEPEEAAPAAEEEAATAASPPPAEAGESPAEAPAEAPPTEESATPEEDTDQQA